MIHVGTLLSSSDVNDCSGNDLSLFSGHASGRSIGCLRAARAVFARLGVVCVLLVVSTGCDPEDAERARREATSRAAEVKAATTQKVDELSDRVEPYVERGKQKARQVYEGGKAKAEELTDAAVEKAGEIKEAVVERAGEIRAATTQKAEEIRAATTQKVEEIRERIHDATSKPTTQGGE